jgi:hypothetical protein
MPSPVAQPGEPLRRRFAIMEVFVHHSCLSYRKSSLSRLIGARIKDAFGASDPYQLTMRYAVSPYLIDFEVRRNFRKTALGSCSTRSEDE